jgi:DNA-binding response OmpR family regulator
MVRALDSRETSRRHWLRANTAGMVIFFTVIRLVPLYTYFSTVPKTTPISFKMSKATVKRCSDLTSEFTIRCQEAFGPRLPLYGNLHRNVLTVKRVQVYLKMNRVLVIDDDRELCSLVGECLAEDGLLVESVHDGKHGLERSLSGRYDIIVLDVMLPGMSGFHVLRKLRLASRVGVVMISARGDEADRILGLEYGADDYLPKPFNPRELVARVRAVCRRLKPSEHEFDCWTPEQLEVGDIELDRGARLCRRSSEIVDLTTVEFNLLELLIKASGRVVSRTDLFRMVLDREFSPFDRSVDIHVGHLRRKLGVLSDGTQRIRTVRNVGYLFARLAISRSRLICGRTAQQSCEDSLCVARADRA